MATTSYKIIETVQLPHTKIELRDDGIIQFFHKDTFQFTMSEIKEMEEVVLKITKGVTHKSLMVAGDFTNVDLEVMKHLSSSENTLVSLADAFVLNSFAQKLLANFYLKINKPVLPTKIFNKVDEAEAWLLSLDNKELEEIHQRKILQLENKKIQTADL